MGEIRNFYLDIIPYNNLPCPNFSLSLYRRLQYLRIRIQRPAQVEFGFAALGSTSLPFGQFPSRDTQSGRLRSLARRPTIFPKLRKAWGLDAARTVSSDSCVQATCVNHWLRILL